MDKKDYSVGSEFAFVYKRDDILIDIECYSAIDFDYKHKRAIDIIISVGKLRNNLLQSYNIFGKIPLEELQCKINKANLKDKPFIYANFLQDNISKLHPFEKGNQQIICLLK